MSSGCERLQSSHSCSVVICTHDRPHSLATCLEALSRQAQHPKEIIVVDNAPAEFPAHELAKTFGARYVYEPLPGLSRARNRGAMAASGDIVAFLDDDSIPARSWLAAITAEFRDPHVIAVTGKMAPPSVETHAERLASAMGGCGPLFESRRVVNFETPLWFELANFGGLGDGANMALRRAAWDVWPGFDERMGRGVPISGGEEHYAIFELIDLGYTVVYTPAAVVDHPYPRTLEQLHVSHLEDLRNGAAYVCLLLFEHPRYRPRLLKYIAEGLWGKRRLWREAPPVRVPRLTSRWKAAKARIDGLSLYFKTRSSRGVRTVAVNRGDDVPGAEAVNQ